MPLPSLAQTQKSSEISGKIVTFFIFRTLI